MAILALGVSHRHATVELLDRLAFTEDDLAKAYRRVLDDPAIDEAVIVSTCNRVEIYGAVPSYHAGFQALKRVLTDTRHVSANDLAERVGRAMVVKCAAANADGIVVGEEAGMGGDYRALAKAEEGAGEEELDEVA